jgi:carbonic anhydrase
MEKAVVDELSDAVKGFMSKKFTKRLQQFRNLTSNKESKNYLTISI